MPRQLISLFCISFALICHDMILIQDSIGMLCAPYEFINSRWKPDLKDIGFEFAYILNLRNHDATLKAVISVDSFILTLKEYIENTQHILLVYSGCWACIT